MAIINYQPETLAEMEKLTSRTIAAQSMKLGAMEGEPLLIAMDGMLRYAKAFEAHHEIKVSEDGFLGDEFGKVISGLRALLNGNGAVAMERNITTDSKDNGVIEALFWECCKVGGFDGDKL